MFPTILEVDEGMDSVERSVESEITSHPDFDGTALWDEGAIGKNGGDRSLLNQCLRKINYELRWLNIRTDLERLC